MNVEEVSFVVVDTAILFAEHADDFFEMLR